MHQIDTHTIGDSARAVIDAYIALPLKGEPSCPYFNNRRRKNRGGLRVSKGKGSPAEIAEEAEIIARLSHVDITNLSKEKLKEFLVKNDLGVDCSGFAYHVLTAFIQEKTGKKLTHFVTSNRTGVIGSFLARLRPAENLGVSSFRNDKNSAAIHVEEIQAGDIITFIGTGKDKTYNHILVVTSVTKEGKHIHITYAHSYMWPSDGLYDHGVREGTIDVTGDDLMTALWTERGVVGNENYTFESARTATEVSVRRLKYTIY